MILLTFAHRKEAEEFFQNEKFQLLPFVFDGLFKSDKYFLLITGEGVQSASEKIISVLASFKEDIHIIINLGIAGSIDPKIKKDSIYEIRTSYAHHAERLEFKSFTTNTKNSSIDCLTLFDRVVDIEKRKLLSPFAQIIDRELWANGSAAHLFKIPFTGIKYISDDLESVDFCKLVIEESPIISQKLFNHFQSIYFHQDLKSSIDPLSFILHMKEFHFTVTQKRLLQNHYEILIRKNISLEEVLAKPEIIEFIKSEMSPKDKTKHLLDHLLGIINPFHYKLTNSFEKIIRPYKNKQIDINYDKNFEDPNLSFTFKVKSQYELNEKIKLIQNFPIEKIEKIFEGNIDV